MNAEEQKLTAYALGELTGKEKEEFEKILKDNPELQAEIDAIREFTGEIEAELKLEEKLSLEGSQREKILQESRGGFTETPKNKKAIPIPFLLTGAAAALVAGYLLLPRLEKSRVNAKDAVAKSEAYEQKKAEEERKVNIANESKDLDGLQKFPGSINTDARGGRYLEQKQQEHAKEDAYREKLAQEKMKRRMEMAERSRVSSEADPAKNYDSHALEIVKVTKPAEELPGTEDNIGFREDLKRNGPVEGNTERYGQYIENAFGMVKDSPLTTFSIDVDTASYTNLRRKLMSGYLPHKDSVRIEEMINYFDYDYPQPEAGRPFSVNAEVAQSPWTQGNKLVRIGLKGKDIKVDKRPSSNLVFLIDVSGSMSSSDKLPLLKEGFQKMVSQLNEKDRVGIVVYAGNAGVVLEPTVCDQRGRDLIIGALGRLNAGGSTNGAGGINEAYRLVQKNFIQGGTNRVILATDGDFNVGVSHDRGLIGLVTEKAKEKAYLTVLGFGQGNLNDRMMEEISNKGNGNYFYIDSAKESTKVLCEKISSTLVTIAKDVKIQIEFNPALVHSYRLIGYDNRRLKNEDFNDDKKDAGEIGAGHSVTAIYEIVPTGSAHARPKVDELKYQPSEKKEAPAIKASEFSDELLTVKLRYKSPEGGPSVLMKHPVKDKNTKFNEASKDFVFSSSVAAFGMLLKSSEYAGEATYEQVEKWITSNNTTQTNESREELLNLVRLVKRLKNGE